MSKTNLLLSSPPIEVEQFLKQLGGNLKTARLRRNLTLAEVARKIGTGPRAVADAERGKPATSVATYAALLWVYGLLHTATDAAAPAHDAAGLALSPVRERARQRRSLDNDF